MNNSLKIAHRGYMRYTHSHGKDTGNNYKDNSIKSINNAILNGFNYIEIDLQLCKDGNIVLYHDLFIKDKLVSELTYKEIKGIDNEIITFEFLLQNIVKRGLRIGLFLNLKGPNITGRGEKQHKLQHILLFILLTNNINLENIFISSYNLQNINILSKLKKKLNLTFKIGLFI